MYFVESVKKEFKVPKEMRIELFIEETLNSVNMTQIEDIKLIASKKCLIVLINPHYKEDQD